MSAIYKRELKSYFHSMIGYVFIAFLIAFTGVYFMAYNLNYGYPYFSYVLSGVLIVFVIAIPVLTMRSFAEERKSRTDQMLLTAPVSLFQVVMGKYLAMVTILAIPCAVYLIFPLIIKSQGTAYILADDMAILVFFLLGCTYISVGMFVSALTESQIIAAIGSVGISVERNYGSSSDFCSHKCDWNRRAFNTDCSCYLAYDKKYCDRRRSGSDRTCWMWDYLRSKVKHF